MHSPSPLPTQTLRTSRPRLRDQLRFLPQRDRRGEPWYRIEHEGVSRFYRLGLGEYELLARLDGRTSIDAARAAAAAASPAHALSGAQAESLVLWAQQQGLLAGNGQPAHPAVPRRKSNLLWIRMPLGTGGAHLDRLARALGWTFTPAAGGLSGILAAIAVALVLAQWERFMRDATALLSVSGSVALLVAWIGLKVVHELGHAVSCRRFGGRVGQFGVAWMVVAPVAYVDLTDAYRIGSRLRRATTAMAGIYWELVLASCAAVLWSQSASPLWCHLLTGVAVMASLNSLVFNLNPLMRLDGYFVLTDLLGRPNLAGDAATELASASSWLFLGRATRSSGSHRGPNVPLLLFGIASATYRLVVVCGLMLAAATMFGRWGLLCGAAVVAAMLAVPLRRAVTAARVAIGARPAVAVRLVGIGGLATLAVAAYQYGSWPRGDAWPGVIEYADVAPVRSEAEGFVTAILVQDGQQVSEGDPLLTLENASLAAAGFEAEAALASAELQDRFYRHRQDMAAIGTQQRTIAALRARSEDLQRQQAALCIVAPRSGTVVAPQLADWQGRWVTAGDAVCHVVDARQMKAICGVPPSGLARLAAGSETRVRVRRGADWLQGRIRTAPAHTGNVPPHPALAASGGGPLAVRPAANGGAAILLMPHARLEVWLELAEGDLPGPPRERSVLASQMPSTPLRAGEPVWIYPQ